MNELNIIDNLLLDISYILDYLYDNKLITFEEHKEIWEQLIKISKKINKIKECL